MAVFLKNAIDYKRFKYNPKVREKLRRECGIDERKFVLGHVGRFGEEKNHSFLIDILYEVKKIECNIVLLLVGTGDLFDSIQEKVKRLGLMDSVIFVGGVLDTAPYYQMMDAFCMPSKFEGLGIAAIEAQASGLPVICSTGMPSEVVLSEHVKRISLEQKDEWIESIVNLSDVCRRNTKAHINLIKSGYDVSYEAQKLVKYYTNNVVRKNNGIS